MLHCNEMVWAQIKNTNKKQDVPLYKYQMNALGGLTTRRFICGASLVTKLVLCPEMMRQKLPVSG